MKLLIFLLSYSLLCSTLVFSLNPPELLVSGLASEDFRERNKAQDELLNWAQSNGPDGGNAIHTLTTTSDEPEVRLRCVEILRSLSDRDYLSDGKGYLGIEFNEEGINGGEGEKGTVGIRITRVVRGSPAEAAGLLHGDTIIALNGVNWNDAGAEQDFIKKIADTKPLEEIVLKISRGNAEPVEIKVRLGKRPLEDLRGIGDDLDFFDQKAREDHFRKWLEAQGFEADS